MIFVSEIWDEAEEIFGHCNERKLLRWITDSVQLLANKGEVDPLVGYVDMCVDNNCVTLPREVESSKIRLRIVPQQKETIRRGRQLCSAHELNPGGSSGKKMVPRGNGPD